MFKSLVRLALGLSVAAFALTGPASANNDRDQRVSQAPSSGCSSYEKAEDGSWRQIPCVTAGSTLPARPRPSASSQASN